MQNKPVPPGQQTSDAPGAAVGERGVASMTQDLQTQRAALESEVGRLEDLLSVNPDWRALRALESGLAAGLYRGQDFDAMNARRQRLHTALLENRVYAAYARLREAVDLMREEEDQPGSQTAASAAPVPTTSTLTNAEPTRSADLGAAIGAASGSATPGTTQEGRHAFPTRVKVRIHSQPPTINDPACTETDQGPDDLTRIRGISKAIAEQLRGLGVTTWDEIANWRRDDVRTLSAALGIDRQISRQNWIEQAAVLCLKRGDVQPASASVGLPQAAKSAAAAPAGVDKDLELERGALLAVPQVQSAALAIFERVSTTQKQVSGSNATEPDLAAPPPEKAPHVEVPQGPKAEPASTTQPDDLTRIANITVDTASALHQAGVATFAQIAAWGVEDVAVISISKALGNRIGNEGWIEQAAILANGGTSAYAANRHLRPQAVAPAAYAASVSSDPEMADVLQTLSIAHPPAPTSESQEDTNQDGANREPTPEPEAEAETSHGSMPDKAAPIPEAETTDDIDPPSDISSGQAPSGNTPEGQSEVGKTELIATAALPLSFKSHDERPDTAPFTGSVAASVADSTAAGADESEATQTGNVAVSMTVPEPDAGSQPEPEQGTGPVAEQDITAGRSQTWPLPQPATSGTMSDVARAWLAADHDIIPQQQAATESPWPPELETPGTTKASSKSDASQNDALDDQALDLAGIDEATVELRPRDAGGTEDIAIASVDDASVDPEWLEEAEVSITSRGHTPIAGAGSATTEPPTGDDDDGLSEAVVEIRPRAITPDSPNASQDHVANDQIQMASVEADASFEFSEAATSPDQARFDVEEAIVEIIPRVEHDAIRRLSTGTKAAERQPDRLATKPAALSQPVVRRFLRSLNGD